MKRIAIFTLLALAAFAPFAGTQPAPQPFSRGAQRTPFPKIIESIKTGKATIYRATAAPVQVITVPKRLSYWGNNQYGDCVTAESVFAVADYSTAIGIDEIFVTDAVTIAWARAHGWLNGAMLLDVMQDMQRDGIKDEAGKLRKTGTPSTVDFSNEEVLKSAIATGPVSIAIDANALPSGAGNKSGWSAFGGRSYQNTDHCVSLSGYGPTAELFKALGATMPANAPANGYFLYTWSTIGVVDHAWIMNTVVEAWVRTPTVTDLAPPTPPPPVPGSITVIIPPIFGGVGVPIKILPTATGGVSPYLFLFDYSDGTQDAAGTHTFKTAGSYTITVTAVDSKGSLGTATCVATISTTPPIPPTPPIPGASGIISWTIDGTTTTFELFPPGTRQKLRDLIGP